MRAAVVCLLPRLRSRPWSCDMPSASSRGSSWAASASPRRSRPCTGCQSTSARSHSRCCSRQTRHWKPGSRRSCRHWRQSALSSRRRQQRSTRQPWRAWLLGSTLVQGKGMRTGRPGMGPTGARVRTGLRRMSNRIKNRRQGTHWVRSSRGAMTYRMQLQRRVRMSSSRRRSGSRVCAGPGVWGPMMRMRSGC